MAEPELISSDANKQIFDILLKEEELAWQSMIYELVAREEMDPWNVDVSKIALKFLDMLKSLKEMDFRVSGKMVLAAAILLKIKSNKLMNEDLTALDSLISSAEEPIDLLEDLAGFSMQEDYTERREKPSLIPRTPQPRKRKVSVYDLVEALEEALEVEVKRKSRPAHEAREVTIPDKPIDISIVIRDVFKKINQHFEKNETLTFSELVPSDSREDKIFTFIPLLHLDNQRKIDIWQKEHLGEIDIEMAKAQ